MNAKKSVKYSDIEQAEWCEYAQEFGIARACRQFGYPSPATGKQWLVKRGVEPTLSNLMESARKYNQFYKTEDLVEVVDGAVAVVEEMFLTAETADDAVKLSNAINRLVQTRNLLEGKANNISEKRELTQQDIEIADLLRNEKARQALQTEDNLNEV